VPSPILKVGLLEEPKSLNPWRSSDAWSSRILSLIYQPLYIRDPESLEFVPWLADSDPVYDDAAISYRITIRDARWSDGEPLTSEDVAYTAELIKAFRIPRYYANWEFVDRVETPDKHTIVFYLSSRRATFTTRSLTTPIVSRREWEPIAGPLRNTDAPLPALLNHPLERPVGSGPFSLVEWKRGGYLHLRRNDRFFGKGRTINRRLLGPYLDGILFKLYGTSDTAVLALKKGSLDMFWWGIQPGYLKGLAETDHIDLHSNEKSALYYLGLNLRKPPFSDIRFRRAVAVLVDKDFILDRLLQGHGVVMDTIVPPGNRFWHSAHVPLHGKGLTRIERAKTALGILRDAGYRWEVPPRIDDRGIRSAGRKLTDSKGNPVPPITILTPPADYDPMRAQAGIFIQEWLKSIGLSATAKPISFSSLSEQVRVRREFDAFIHGYGNLSLDPDYVRSFFHSRFDRIHGRNTSGYRNPEFDSLSDLSASTMDRGDRQQLLHRMQRMIAGDLPWIPLYNPHIIEAVRTDRFTGWVDMPVGIGNWWSFCQLKPVDRR